MDVEQWRARIGSYTHKRGSSLPRFIRVDSVLQSAVAVAMSLLLINALLIIGCVEQHPGPQPFQCSFCPMSFKTPSSYAQHQNVHSTQKNFSFPCCVCDESMTSGKGFQVHFSRFHTNAQTAHPAPGRDHLFADVLHDETFKCTLPTCQESCRTTRLLRKHMAKHLENGHVVLCPFQPCQNRFSKLSTFRTHTSQYHKAEQDGDSSVGEIDGRIYFGSDFEDSDPDDDFGDPLDAPVGEDEGRDENEGQDEDEQENLIINAFGDDESEENIYPPNLVRDHLVKFYLLLEGEMLLPSTKVQRISTEIAILSRISHHQIKAALKAEMEKAGIDKETAEAIINAGLKSDIIYAAHHKNMDVLDMTTTFLRYKAFKQRCAYIPFDSIFLGRNDSGKKSHASFIKIKDTLLYMFNDLSVQKQIDASFSKASDKSTYTDFIDGSTFTQHPICQHMDSIQLILFQDAFEFFPLSVASSLYKCVGFYFVLGNMNPESRSKVDAIQLTYLVKEADLKFFSPEVCLQSLVNELQELAQNGIEYKGRTLPVVLMHMCGDNLGQHYIGKFAENFSSGEFFCRFCEISRSTIKKTPHATMPIRTPEDYDSSAAQVDPQDPESHVKGIKGQSFFNSIPAFHVSNPGQPPCIGHDILEGIAKKDYALFLKYFIDIKKWFTIEDVNRRIANFHPSGRDAADGMAKLDPKLEKIRGHASEVWLFIRMLPFLISDKIPDKEDKVWKLCLELKVICEYVFAPMISKIQVAKLKELINLYVAKRAQIFNKPLLPKHHYVCHYAVLIAFFGPLIRLWTLRFESRHVFFKKAAKAANNFVNITTTLANKYVLNFAYKMTQNLIMSEIIYNAKDVTVVNLEELVPPVRNLVRIDPTFDKVLKSVTVHGIEYKPGLWVLIGCTGKNLVVGEINLIVYNKHDVKFILKVHEATNTFQGYYEINSGDFHYSAKKVQDLADYYPLSSYNFKGKCCLSLKHSNPSMDSV